MSVLTELSNYIPDLTGKVSLSVEMVERIKDALRFGDAAQTTVEYMRATRLGAKDVAAAKAKLARQGLQYLDPLDCKEHRLCDCSPYEGKCPLGVERTLATTRLSRCLLPSASEASVSTRIEPTYYVRHPDGSYSVAERRPHKTVQIAICGEVHEIDAGIADLVVALNNVPGIRTLTSCQGSEGGEWPYAPYVTIEWNAAPQAQRAPDTSSEPAVAALPNDKLQSTPRTDEMETYYSEIITGRDHGLYWVKADFARLLERELEAMRATWSESNRCYLEQFDRAERLQREIQKICQQQADADAERDAPKSATTPTLTCPRCGDEWRGQACVGDCPLWKMVAEAKR